METTPSSQNDQQLKGTRVLVADDSYVNRRILRRFLEPWEVAMDEASDGREALDLFNSHSYDLLLIDLDMPVMDGYAVIAAIREKNTAIPALAFTAAELPQLECELRAHGFSGLLRKPFQAEALYTALMSCQGTRQII